MKNPKFEQKVLDNIVNPALGGAEANGVGVILVYYPRTNTADIMANRMGSNLIGEIYKEVQCPTTQGVQAVGPTAGTMCRIAFRSKSQTDPYITSYFDHEYETNSYYAQNHAQNEIPSFLGLL